MTTDSTTDAPVEASDPAPETEPARAEERDWKAEYERLQADSRKWETRAKSNAEAAKELEKLRAQQMTEQEKAIAEAVAATRTGIMAEVGTKLARASIEAALTGVVPNPADVIEDLNLARYIGEDGEPDSKAIDKLRAKYAALIPAAPAAPKVPTGKRGGVADVITTRAQLQSMTPDEIWKAQQSGRIQIAEV